MGPHGAFVQIEGGTDSIGKFVDADAIQAEIEYFESPAGPRLHRIKANIASVRVVEHPSQTRVFWFDSGSHTWRAGRVDGGLISAEALRTSEDHYHVRFPNDQEARIPVSQLYVHWSRPIEDPTDYLAARITDTPFFFDGRSQIVRHIAAQRAAFGGLTALAFFSRGIA
jgi:ATP-dependent helicase HepA